MTKDIYEITLTAWAYGGEALGHLPDWRVVFVPFCLPGERVRIRLVEQKGGFARGELIELLEASPERVTPRCRHFSSLPSATRSSTSAGGTSPDPGPFCGGCHYQHMSYAAQLAAKMEILRDQLQRIGKIENPPVRPAVACPQPWNYRNHLQFHHAPDGRLGFVRFGGGEPSVRDILPVTECHLPEEPIAALWPQLELDPAAGIERLSIRLGADGEMMLALESASPDVPELEIEAEVSVAHVYRDQTLMIAGADHLIMRLAGRDFRVSPDSFFQVNTLMAEKMLAHLMERLPLPAETVLDVYCGVGLFSAFLAPRCRRLVAVEASTSACDDFTLNLDEFDNVELYEGLAEDILPRLDLEPEVALLDPPRAGLERRALDALCRLGPRRIAYVSCDPSTLARDARRLIDAGWELTEAVPFDLFPQTYHIESISIFER